ncbi:MAG: PAS domain-containing sensor histidine kinase [Deltaproteobacteria bacterium]|nr:PAS domain-containing sensor histidine kinase [Deltaproteobacteria bacterium]
MVKEGSLSLSANGVVIRFGYGLEFILGYSASEMIGKEFACLTPPGLEEHHKSFFDSSVWVGSVTSHRTQLVRKDGALIDIYLSVYPLRDMGGELYSFVVTVSIDKDLQAPAILSEEFQRMFRFSNDAVAVTDRDGNIIDVNQSFLKTYGYTKAEVLGKNPRMLKSGHSTPALYERMWSEILDPEKGWWRGEIINIARDGREVPVLLSINAIKDLDGQIKNFLGVAFDMTREKEFDRINKMYIDYIIHDMRSPLMTIMTNAELLLMQSDEKTPDKMKKKLKVILSCSEKLNHMTSDILDYSRAQSGSLILRKEKASLAKIVRDAIMPFEHMGKKLFLNGFSYEEGVLEDAHAVVDADKLQRVIYNLLSNAFKNASSEVRLFVDFTAEEVRFVVTDDGKGISDEEAARIFEVFYQTDEGVKSGGAGIGLNIVKSFVEAHGGAVWVEPGHGHGATFGFTLPLG